MEKPTLPINEERFWSKVDKSGSCWRWTAAILNGYGRFGVWRDGKQRSGLAHRVAYELSGRDIPDGMFLDHACRNRACVNPAHLRVVNNKQNLENHGGATVKSSTGVRGVYWHSPSRKWRATATSNGRSYSAGYFETIAEAEVAVIALRNRLFTHNNMDRQNTEPRRLTVA